MKRPPPGAEPEIPTELSLPYVPAREVGDWRQLEQGQVIELRDGQQGVLLTVNPAPLAGGSGSIDSAALALRFVRTVWPRDSVLPLGQTVELTAEQAAAQGPILVHGAWYTAKGVLLAERVVIEAIARGLITVRSCGVRWPLAATWQLSNQATDEIEKYLFEVARTTGCAFPFHDIAQALRQMHLRLSMENAAQVDIVSGESPGRIPHSDDEMLGMWARTLQQKIMASDFTVVGIVGLPPVGSDSSGA
jgi:hypothetical protein